MIFVVVIFVIYTILVIYMIGLCVLYDFMIFNYFCNIQGLYNFYDVCNFCFCFIFMISIVFLLGKRSFVIN